MRDEVGRRGETASTLPTSILDLALGTFLGGYFIPESDVLGSLSDGDAGFYLALVEPALVHRVVRDVGGTAHAVVEVQLLHEALVGLRDGAAEAHRAQGGLWSRGPGATEEIGNDQSRRA